MKPITRSAIVIAVLVVIALLIWLMTQGGKQEAATDTGAVQQPVAPTPPPAPPAPKPVEAVTATVLFDYDASAIRPTEATRLDGLAVTFAGGGYDRIDAIGYTDRIGSDSYNRALSGRRADAVGSYLVAKGVDAGKVGSEAKGENDAVTGDSCRNMGRENRKNKRLIECLQPDRRVQVTLVPAR